MIKNIIHTLGRRVCVGAPTATLLYKGLLLRGNGKNNGDCTTWETVPGYPPTAVNTSEQPLYIW